MARAVRKRQASLPLTEPAAVEPAVLTASVSERLWFCIHLPRLPLEACQPTAEASAVLEEQRGVYRVLLANDKACAAGVQAGQSGNAALALLPELQLVQRSVPGERQALERLAASLERYTSCICIAGRDVLLLEIAGSLRLFGGLRSLRTSIADELEQQGFQAALAIAPTPLAATWLARAGQRVCIRDVRNLAAALRKLPLSCLAWPESVCASLSGVGVSHVADCLRLPRAGFAKRFGSRQLLELDRALGRLPDPRASWRAAERFCHDHELCEEQSDRAVLLTVCQDLLHRLEDFLRARQFGTQHIRFSFFHLKAAATELSLGCASAERTAARWFDLLRLRFEHFSLPEAVIAIRLQGGATQALAAEVPPLPFHARKRNACSYSIRQLAERLSARIGKHSVSGIVTVAEHRPQCAWASHSLLDEQAVAALPAMQGVRRPLWMLPEPALLMAEQGYPVHEGRLTLLNGPERLETGWWDEDSIARDYYTAINPAGRRLWVFRNRKREQAAWYLHGLFG